MGVAVLGPLTINGSDGVGPRDRVVLEVLVARMGNVVDQETLADALWHESPPATWPKVVQGCVARLRKSLGPGWIETHGHGYRLIANTDEVDCRRFERMLVRVREHLLEGDPDRASYVAAEALALWRGSAFLDLDEWPPGRIEAERLDGLRLEAQELWVEAEMLAGRSRGILEDARRLVAEGPFREARWALLARALYQCGRQKDALGVLHEARRRFREELGLDPGPELLDLEGAILRQDPNLIPGEAVKAATACPYRGLLPYELDDSDSFFGREAEVAACLERLRSTQVLAVVGPSGSGKSSLVRAGVAAALVRDGADVAVVTPGVRPLDSLAGLPRRGRPLTLVVDQAEEAVTLCTDAQEREEFFGRLGAYDGPLVLAIRADHLGHLSAYRELVRIVESGLYLLPTMGEEQLRAAIEGPARQAGLRLEPGLVDLLVHEIGSEPGALPLLSHVLRRTWELREGSTLTVDGYRRTGGIRDALAQSAEALYDQLDSAKRAHLRALLLRLVMPTSDGAPVRARVARGKVVVDAAHEQLIEQLVHARLVSSDDGELQLAHEALAREWPRFRDWLAEDADGLRIFRHLAQTAEGWDVLGRPGSELYRGVRLAGAVEWADRNTDELNPTERAFLDASVANADRERSAAEAQARAQARSNHRLRLSLAGLAALLVAALVAGLLAVLAARRADRAATVADARRLGAQALSIVEADVATLLALESLRLDDSAQAYDDLSQVLAKKADVKASARGEGPLHAVDVSPDGDTLAVASADVGLTLYDAATLDPLASNSTLAGEGVRYSPDGRFLAVAVDPPPSGAAPATLQLLDPETLEPVVVLGGMPRRMPVRDAIAFSADGRWLAARFHAENEPDGPVLVWNLDRPGQPHLTLPLLAWWTRLALSADGRRLYLATSAPDSTRSYDLVAGSPLAQRDERHASASLRPALALSPDGTTLAVHEERRLVFLDAETLEERLVIPSPHAGVISLAFSHDGAHLASGGADGTAYVWDVQGEEPGKPFAGHIGGVWGVRFAPDDETLYAVGTDGQVLAWEATGAGSLLPTTRFPDNPSDFYNALISPDGTRVAYPFRGDPQSITFRDLGTGALTERTKLTPVSPALVSTEWAPDSRHLVYVGDTRASVEVLDATDGKVVERRLGNDVAAMTHLPDGKALVTGYDKSAEAVWVVDTDSWTATGSPVEVQEPVAQMWPVPSTTTALVSTSDGTHHLVDHEAGRVLVSRDLGGLHSVAFLPDGSRAAAVTEDSAVGVLDTGTLEWLVEPRPVMQDRESYAVTFVADGALIVTAGFRLVEFWDPETLESRGSLPADELVPISMRLLPDGETLMFADWSGSVVTWEARPTALVDAACARAGRNLTRDEWETYLGDRPYHETCPDLESSEQP